MSQVKPMRVGLKVCLEKHETKGIINNILLTFPINFSIALHKLLESSWSPCCDTMRSMVSLEPWDPDSNPSPAQWVKDPALPQWHRSQLWLGSNPWWRNSICCGVAKKEKKNYWRFLKSSHISPMHIFYSWEYYASTHTLTNRAFSVFPYFNSKLAESHP